MIRVRKMGAGHRDLGSHDLAYKKNFERIDLILAAEVVAAPGNFLG